MHIVEQKIQEAINKNDKIAVAVSGGVDSMVLCYALNRCSTKFTGLHCNFQLRGRDSLADQKMIEEWFHQKKIPFHYKKFDTKRAQKNGESIQMTARRLRYDWFHEFIDNQIDTILMGHHLDDRIESFWMNLYRGTGVVGLLGIPKEKNNFKRPFLGISKKDILDYANLHKITYREDATNQKLDYFRNQIRHQFLPALKKEVSNNEWNHFFSNQEKINAWIDVQIEQLAKRYIREEKNQTIINRTVLTLPWLWQYYLLRPYGFKKKHRQRAESLARLESGKEVAMEAFTWYFDRKHIFVKNAQEAERRPIEKRIQSHEGSFQTERKKIFWQYINAAEINWQEENTSYIDTENIKGTLELKPLQNGQKIQPIGMKGSKKLSDVLAEAGVPSHKKRKELFLNDNENTICWPGNIVSEQYKIQKSTQQVLKLFVENLD